MTSTSARRAVELKAASSAPEREQNLNYRGAGHAGVMSPSDTAAVARADHGAALGPADLWAAAFLSALGGPADVHEPGDPTTCDSPALHQRMSRLT
jgi:hypothetical protein